MDQIHELSHSLNSDWTIINYVAYFFNQERLSKSDYQLYTGMFSRAKAGLQFTLTQLLIYLPQRDFLNDLVRLINQIEIHNLLLITVELEPLVSKLQQLLKELLNS